MCSVLVTAFPFSSYLSAKHALTKIAKGIIKVCKEDVGCPFLVSLSHTHTLVHYSFYCVYCLLKVWLQTVILYCCSVSTQRVVYSTVIYVRITCTWNHHFWVCVWLFLSTDEGDWTVSRLLWADSETAQGLVLHSLRKFSDIHHLTDTDWRAWGWHALDTRPGGREREECVCVTVV